MDQRLNMLRALLRDPASDPALAALLIAAGALFVLVIVLLLLAWAAPSGGWRVELTPVERRRDPGARRRGCAWSVVVALLALAAAGAAYAVTSGDAYCGTVCHSMSAAHGSWRASAHADVACARCHEGVPVLSAPAAVLSRTREIISEVASTPIAGVSSVPVGTCMACHQSIASKVIVGSSGIAMAHQQVIAAGAACDDCHGAQGHERRGSTPTMSSCLRCHDGQRADVACRTCHRKPAERTTTPLGQRFGKVTLPEQPTCGGCHDEESCDACHGLRMPHPDGYAEPRQHARPAAFEGKDRLCYRCHTFSDCRRCHEPFDEHGPDWKATHATYPRESAACTRCHETRGLCGVCHP